MTIHTLRRWADEVIGSRPPDRVIGENYLQRWYVIPRNDFSNVYLHRFTGSDDPRAFHDHPWSNTSVVLRGEMIEHTPDGVVTLEAGDVIVRDATTLHRFELVSEECITLFITGPTVRNWGFQCPQGWVPWQQFCDPDDSTQIGRGCD